MMNRRTFLKLLAAAGVNSMANFGAFAAPPGCDAPESDMPDGWQSVGSDRVILWGQNPAGSVVLPAIAARILLVQTLREDGQPCTVYIPPLADKFKLGGGDGAQVAWIAAVERHKNQ